MNRQLMLIITIFHVSFKEMAALIFIAEASAAKCDFCEFNMQVHAIQYIITA